MKKYAKVIASVITTMLVASSFVGCSSSSSDSKKGGKTITVWSHLTDPEIKEVKKVADEWASKTGNTVKVVTDKDNNFQNFSSAAQSSKGPDMLFGYPHNDLGVYQKAGLLDEVPSGVIDKDKYASTGVVDAVTWGGKQYAVPLAMETYALFYNTDKVKDAPKTVDDLIKDAQADGGFQYDLNNFYFEYAWLASNGGYIFKNNNGTLDTKDIGLGNEGAKKGYQFIQDLVKKYNFMKADIKGDDAKGAFQNGKIAFYLSGPWDVSGFKQAGTKFNVEPIPTVNGQPAKSLMTVQAAFVSAKSKNKDAAWDLMKTLMANDYDIVYKAGSRLPVYKDDLNKDEFKKDSLEVQFSEQAKNAEPTPNIPEMSAVWTPGGNNLQLLTQGKQSADKTAELFVQQVQQGIAQQK